MVSEGIQMGTAATLSKHRSRRSDRSLSLCNLIGARKARLTIREYNQRSTFPHILALSSRSFDQDREAQAGTTFSLMVAAISSEPCGPLSAVVSRRWHTGI